MPDISPLLIIFFVILVAFFTMSVIGILFFGAIFWFMLDSKRQKSDKLSKWAYQWVQIFCAILVISAIVMIGLIIIMIPIIRYS